MIHGYAPLYESAWRRPSGRDSVILLRSKERYSVELMISSLGAPGGGIVDWRPWLAD